jgi:hypothetical protein
MLILGLVDLEIVMMCDDVQTRGSELEKTKIKKAERMEETSSLGGFSFDLVARLNIWNQVDVLQK